MKIWTCNFVNFDIPGICVITTLFSITPTFQDWYAIGADPKVCARARARERERDLSSSIVPNLRNKPNDKGSLYVNSLKTGRYYFFWTAKKLQLQITQTWFQIDSLWLSKKKSLIILHPLIVVSNYLLLRKHTLWREYFYLPRLSIFAHSCEVFFSYSHSISFFSHCSYAVLGCRTHFFCKRISACVCILSLSRCLLLNCLTLFV